MTTARKGAECPDCGSTDTPASLGGWDIDGQRLRQRVCRDCTFRFVTVEVPVMLGERSIPYSWVDEDYRRRQREHNRRLVPRSNGRGYRGLKTKPVIEGVARVIVRVRVELEKGMRPDTQHGTAVKVYSQADPHIDPRTLVPVKDRRAIARRWEAGESTAQLAREYRISTRSVNRYVQRYGEAA